MSAENERIGVGACPKHGIVSENDGIEYNFPKPSKCFCGKVLTKTWTTSNPQ